MSEVLFQLVPLTPSYFARSGEVLSLECPRESTQREGHPGALIGWRRFLPFLAPPGARTTRDLAVLDSLKQGARLIPDWLRYSVSANGKGRLVLGVGFDFPHPSGAAEHRSENRFKLAPCLSAASCVSAGLHEKRKGPA